MDVLCKSRWTDQDALLGADSCGSKETYVRYVSRFNSINSQLQAVKSRQCGLLLHSFGHLFCINVPQAQLFLMVLLPVCGWHVSPNAIQLPKNTPTLEKLGFERFKKTIWNTAFCYSCGCVVSILCVDCSQKAGEGTIGGAGIADTKPKISFVATRLNSESHHVINDHI